MSYIDKELLHVRPYIECTSETDIERHDEEVNRIFEAIGERIEYAAIRTAEIQPNYDVRYFFADINNISEILQFGDFKNGIDFSIDEGILKMVMHGQNYSVRGDNSIHTVERETEIVFLDRETVEAVPGIDSADDLDVFFSSSEMQDVLKELFQKGKDAAPYNYSDVVFAESLREIKREYLFEYLENAGYVMTDDSGPQFRKRMNQGIYSLVEAQQMPDETYIVYGSVIDLNEMDKKEIEEYVLGYYDSMESFKEYYPTREDQNSVAAECVFEQQAIMNADFSFFSVSKNDFLACMVRYVSEQMNEAVELIHSPYKNLGQMQEYLPCPKELLNDFDLDEMFPKVIWDNGDTVHIGVYQYSADEKFYLISEDGIEAVEPVCVLYPDKEGNYSDEDGKIIDSNCLHEFRNSRFSGEADDFSCYVFFDAADEKELVRGLDETVRNCESIAEENTKPAKETKIDKAVR